MTGPGRNTAAPEHGEGGAERIDYGALVDHAADEARKVALTAGWILQEFDAYYIESRGIPKLAQQAFEQCDHGTSLTLSRRRLSIYSESIHRLGPRLTTALPFLAESERLWRQIERIYLPLISDVCRRDAVERTPPQDACRTAGNSDGKCCSRRFQRWSADEPDLYWRSIGDSYYHD